jgi:cell wall-associated NlpC family hydrolase
LNDQKIHNQLKLPNLAPLNSIKLWREPQLPHLEENPRQLLLRLAEESIGHNSSMYLGRQKGTDLQAGVDCSGLIVNILLKVQERFPKVIFHTNMRHASEMWDSLGIYVDPPKAIPGDLVFFTHQGSAPKHVGVYYGQSENQTRYMIHSPGFHGDKIEISTIEPKLLTSTTPHQIYTHTLIGYKRVTLQSRKDRWKQIPIQ